MSNCDKSILIVANGKPISKQIFEQLLQKVSFVLAADGGANLLKNYDFQPNAIIGDFDSCRKSDFSQWTKTRWISANNQNKNDLEKALDWGIKQGFSNFYLASVLGNRADQSFATFSICRKFAMQCNIQIHTNLERIFVLSKSHKISAKLNQIISILPLSMSAEISSDGLEYTLTNTVLSAGSQGISNIASKSNISIEIHSGSVLLVQNR